MADGIRVAVVNLQAIRGRAAAAGPRAAAAMAGHARGADRRILTLLAHPANTKTPSPPGLPPAAITGQLAASITASDASPAGPSRWQARTGPTRAASSAAGPYGRFLEFGGSQEAHTSRGMRWRDESGWHTAHRLVKEERPYLADALGEIVADGSLHDAAVTAFRRAMGF